MSQFIIVYSVCIVNLFEKLDTDVNLLLPTTYYLLFTITIYYCNYNNKYIGNVGPNKRITTE